MTLKTSIVSVARSINFVSHISYCHNISLSTLATNLIGREWNVFIYITLYIYTLLSVLAIVVLPLLFRLPPAIDNSKTEYRIDRRRILHTGGLSFVVGQHD